MGRASLKSAGLPGVFDDPDFARRYAAHMAARGRRTGRAFSERLKREGFQQGCILDAGCGGGRNLEPFLRCEYDVVAVDASLRAVRQAARLGAEIGGCRPRGWVSRQSVDDLGFGDGTFDAVICCAVLHFAADRKQWEAWIDELWRVLAPKGLFFARLASCELCVWAPRVLAASLLVPQHPYPARGALRRRIPCDRWCRSSEEVVPLGGRRPTAWRRR